MQMVLVGHKCKSRTDKSDVSDVEGREVATELSMKYCEVRDNEIQDVEAAFYTLYCMIAGIDDTGSVFSFCTIA